MNGVRELVTTGGPVILVLMGLSVLLYQRCFSLMLFLRSSRRELAALPAPEVVGLATLRRKQHELVEGFRQQRLAIGAMITAAPLLGLLGTVMGMIQAFDGLSVRGAQRSMEGLAQGISEVLIATESGLAVAIPAVLLLYVAHRQTEKGVQRLAALEGRLLENT